ncbi:MAG TPA: alpha/beta hydrolase, partial [Phnomibacter sp.]|nr:alpha/beta hydrolase [Phnomibacter sp.]
IEVTHYLRERFGKDKIYIMAHSGGTPIALLATSRHPELYHAYMAMAQITDQAASEIRAYQFMMEHFTKKGDAKKVNALEKYPVTGPDADVLTFYRSAIRDQLMHEAGIGTMRHMRSVIRDIFLPSWFCRAYTLPEKMGLWRSKFSFLPKTGLHRAVISTDFAARVPRLDVPVYFFSGKHDLTVNTGLSKAYFEKLQAPLKGFYFFQHSAHSPLYEEPGRVRQIVAEDVLHLQNDLADEK